MCVILIYLSDSCVCVEGEGIRALRALVYAKPYAARVCWLLVEGTTRAREGTITHFALSLNLSRHSVTNQ